MTNGPFSGGFRGRVDIDSAAAAAAAATTAATTAATSTAASLEGKRSSSRRYILVNVNQCSTILFWNWSLLTCYNLPVQVLPNWGLKGFGLVRWGALELNILVLGSYHEICEI